MKRIAIVGTRPPKKGACAEEWGAIRADVLVFVAAMPADAVLVTGDGLGVHEVARKAWPFDRDRQVFCALKEDGKAATAKMVIAAVDDADEVHVWPAPWSFVPEAAISRAEKRGKPCVVHEPWKGNYPAPSAAPR